MLTANCFLLYCNTTWAQRTYSDNVFHHLNTAIGKGMKLHLLKSCWY